MSDFDKFDPLLRQSDLMAVAESLIDCQDILDKYHLLQESAYLDLALNLLRAHVPVPEPSLSQLMRKLGFGELSVDDMRALKKDSLG
jgi:hypothetical protein